MALSRFPLPLAAAVLLFMGACGGGGSSGKATTTPVQSPGESVPPASSAEDLARAV